MWYYDMTDMIFRRTEMQELTARAPSTNEYLYMSLQDAGYNATILYAVKVSAFPDKEKL